MILGFFKIVSKDLVKMVENCWELSTNSLVGVFKILWKTSLNVWTSKGSFGSLSKVWKFATWAYWLFCLPVWGLWCCFKRYSSLLYIHFLWFFFLLSLLEEWVKNNSLNWFRMGEVQFLELVFSSSCVISFSLTVSPFVIIVVRL